MSWNCNLSIPIYHLLWHYFVSFSFPLGSDSIAAWVVQCIFSSPWIPLWVEILLLHFSFYVSLVISAIFHLPFFTHFVITTLIFSFINDLPFHFPHTLHCLSGLKQFSKFFFLFNSQIIFRHILFSWVINMMSPCVLCVLCVCMCMCVLCVVCSVCMCVVCSVYVCMCCVCCMCVFVYVLCVLLCVCVVCSVTFFLLSLKVVIFIQSQFFLK